MKVFVSSLIVGFEELRDAAAAAILMLGYQPLRAENYPASPDSPQTACLAGVREADAVVMILGERYGYPQRSGLSATHEEYREARGTRPVLVFIRDGGAREAKQDDFVREVQGWETGHYTASFSNAHELRDKVARALHEYTLAATAAPLDEPRLLARAQELVPKRVLYGGPTLFVSVAPGPTRAVLRPAELEADGLMSFLLGESLTGPYAVLSTVDGTDRMVRGDAIELTQRQLNRLVRLDESGRIAVALPAVTERRGITEIPSIIEEDLRESIGRALRLAARLLDHIDPASRLTHVAVAVALVRAEHLPWRTRAEQERSPNQATIGMRADGEVVITLTPPTRRRPALKNDTMELAEDFTVRLRRALRQ